MPRLTVREVAQLKVYHDVGYSAQDLANYFNIHPVSVSRIINGHTHARVSKKALRLPPLKKDGLSRHERAREAEREALQKTVEAGMTPPERRQYRREQAAAARSRLSTMNIQDEMRSKLREDRESRRAAWEAVQVAPPQPAVAINEADTSVQEEVSARQQRKGGQA